MSKFIMLTKWADVPEAKTPVCINVASISFLRPRVIGNEVVTAMRVDGHTVEVCEPFAQIAEWLGVRVA